MNPRALWIGGLAGAALLVGGGIAYAASVGDKKPSSSGPVAPPSPSPLPPTPPPPVVSGYARLYDPVTLMPGQTYVFSYATSNAAANASPFEQFVLAAEAAGVALFEVHGVPSDWPADDRDPSRTRGRITTPMNAPELLVPNAEDIHVYVAGVQSADGRVHVMSPRH